MRLQFLILAGFLALASCSTPDTYKRTELGRTAIALWQQPRTSEESIRQPGKQYRGDFLQDAAFALTKGMDADRAIRFFESDGARCNEWTCQWVFIKREPLVTCCVRPPGPRHTVRVYFEVELKSPTISDLDDIEAREWVKHGGTKQ